MEPTSEQQMELARRRDLVLVQHAKLLVAKDGPDAATVALYVLQDFAATYGAVRAQMPEEVRRLIAAAGAAVKAATDAVQSQVVLAERPPLVIAKS